MELEIMFCLSVLKVPLCFAFDMFPTSKCSSSGKLVHAVLWYYFHATIYELWSMVGRKFRHHILPV
jgi:hypothetical protein